MVAIVLAIGLCPFVTAAAIPAGLLALRDVSRNGRRGRRLAIAAIVLADEMLGQGEQLIVAGSVLVCRTRFSANIINHSKRGPARVRAHVTHPEARAP